MENILEDAILKIDDVSVSYGKKQVLDGFSLLMKKGDKLVVAGPNGCGKTTLLKSILGIIKPTSGGIHLAQSTRTAYCKQGFTTAATTISVYEVVGMGLYKQNGKDRTCVERAMRETGVQHLASRPFNGLSGGEKQRVSLARCLCQDANLLLLDEPSSFLDADSCKDFISLMKSLPLHIAAIVVTHDDKLIQGLGWPVVEMKAHVEAPWTE